MVASLFKNNFKDKIWSFKLYIPYAFPHFTQCLGKNKQSIASKRKSASRPSMFCLSSFLKGDSPAIYLSPFPRRWRGILGTNKLHARSCVCRWDARGELGPRAVHHRYRRARSCSPASATTNRGQQPAWSTSNIVKKKKKWLWFLTGFKVGTTFEPFKHFVNTLFADVVRWVSLKFSVFASASFVCG